MGLLEDYEGYLKKYQKLYGVKTAVLYQNGMFFETYGVDNATEKVGIVKEISEMLSIQLTRRTKAILENDRSNFLMAGFPINQLDRYVAILTEEYGYVVVVVEQITPPPNPQRGVTSVISPGVNLKCSSHPYGNYLVSIYIEHEGRKVKHIKPITLVTVGLSAIDVSTGQSVIYEIGNLLDDENHAFDETYRFIQTFQPREILINTQHLEMTQEELVSYFDLGQALIHCRLDGIPADYYRLTFQNEFLGKVFKDTGMLKPIEFLNLERHPTALISYLALLDFCYQHSELMIERIEAPTIWNNIRYLTLDNNCINQLNLVSPLASSQKISSVYNLMDQTSTAMGKRLLKEKLLLPLVDPVAIEKRYECVEYFRHVVDASIAEQCGLKHLSCHQQYYRFQLYEIHLKQISDVERLQRKISLGLLQPSELGQLDVSYQEVIQLASLCETSAFPKASMLGVPLPSKDSLLSYTHFYTSIIDLEKASKYNLSTLIESIFNRGYHQEIDLIQDQIDENLSYFQQLSARLSQILGGGGGGGSSTATHGHTINYETTEDHGYHLNVTTTRWNSLVSSWKDPIVIKTKNNQYIITPSSLEVIKNRNGKTCKLTSHEMKTLSRQLKDLQETLLKQVVDVYHGFLSQWTQKFTDLMKNIVLFVSHLDLYKSHAKTSLLYNYCRPQLRTSDAPASYLSVTQIRHPLIEQLQTRCQYVPQDALFDIDNCGLLLFGVNKAGKSSLMKALGIALILAQAGMYVPAQQMIFTPYHHVLTRILGNDNLFKGQSSFDVEMIELRGILKRADSYSLVLGDEICHGTETTSGVSLVAAAIMTLSQKRAHFLFATHLHQLSVMSRMTQLTNVKMYHLKVTFDQQTGHLIYDRHLEPGPGKSLYGLEVAKAMGLETGFITLANDIRKEITDETEIISLKKSKYNTEIYMDRCGIPECPNPATVTHHIKFQADATPTGFNAHIQKNHMSNLVPLCESCHHRLHDDQEGHEKLVIHGYKMTSDGYQLDYDWIRAPIKTPDPPVQPELSPPTPKRPLLRLHRLGAVPAPIAPQPISSREGGYGGNRRFLPLPIRRPDTP